MGQWFFYVLLGFASLEVCAYKIKRQKAKEAGGKFIHTYRGVTKMLIVNRYHENTMHIDFNFFLQQNKHFSFQFPQF